MDDLADLYRRKLNLPNAIFTYIDHEDAMVAAVFKISQPENSDLLSNDPRIPFTMKFEEGLEECEGYLPESLLETCRRHFKKDIDLLLSTDGPCIIHRDFRPGNLIAAHGKVYSLLAYASMGQRNSRSQMHHVQVKYRGNKWLPLAKQLLKEREAI